MPKDHTGFQGGNRRGRRIAASDDVRPVRVQWGRRDRIDCRGAGRNRVARIERQHVATDNGRHERGGGASFGSDRPYRASNSRRQQRETDLTQPTASNVKSAVRCAGRCLFFVLLEFFDVAIELPKLDIMVVD
jgi:hypothetical protein